MIMFLVIQIVVHKDGPRGVHFRRAGQRQKVYFESDEVHACIVTCGGLCPGLNTVIREIVSSLSYMYGVKRILGIDVSFCESLFIYGLEFLLTIVLMIVICHRVDTGDSMPRTLSP